MNQLAKESLGASLSDADRTFIEQNSSRLRFRAEEVLFRDGDACANFVMVLSGSICVQKVSESGSQITLYHVDRDNVCILTTSCLLGNAEYAAEGIAVSEVEALVLSRQYFRELMDRSASFREFIFASFAARIGSVIMAIKR